MATLDAGGACLGKGASKQHSAHYVTRANTLEDYFNWKEGFYPSQPEVQHDYQRDFPSSTVTNVARERSSTASGVLPEKHVCPSSTMTSGALKRMQQEDRVYSLSTMTSGVLVGMQQEERFYPLSTMTSGALEGLREEAKRESESRCREEESRSGKYMKD